MDWNGLLETVRNASSLYWVAAAAIAAGVSLLAAALVLQLRRRRPTAAPSRRESTASVVAPRTAVAAPGGYTAASLAQPVVPAQPDLGPVTARLAAAADRLAEIQAELAAEHVVSPESILKETPSHVEYVFRTSEA